MSKDKGCGCCDGCDKPVGHNAGQPVFVPTPDAEEIPQYNQEDFPTLPVKIEGVVPVWSLPAKYGSMDSKIMDVNRVNMVHVTDPDPRVKRLIISATGGAWLGTLEKINAVNGPYGFYLPANVVVVFEGISESMFAMAADNTPTPHISWRQEFWAD